MAEYNPFHKGHKYQIEKIKEELNADYIIAVMSGNFVMRGEPALYNKFLRAKAAILSGADLVIGLPVCYALSSAEYFAKGAVSILNSLNIVDYISFGSECGDISKLSEIADKLIKEETVELIKEKLKTGIPVFDAYSSLFDDDKKEILKSPNNILAINYIKALKNLESKIIPHTVKRIKNDYNDIKPNEDFASATAIRELLKDGKDISLYIAEENRELFKNAEPVMEEEFSQSLIYSLRVKDKEEYLKYADVGEGLHNLIKRSALENNSISDVAMAIKSKRYSYTRIKRILYNIYLDIPSFMRENQPECAKVLAFNDKGKDILGSLREKSKIPVFTNETKEMYDKYKSLNIEKKADNIYKLICGEKQGFCEKIIL